MATSHANTLTTVAATALIALASLASLGGWAEPDGDGDLRAGRDVRHQVVHRTIEIDGQENAEALRGLLTIDATKWQYTHGVRNIEAISPDNWHIDQRLLDRPGNAEIQLALFYDYRTNVPLYPQWQRYLRTQQPPTLIIWGKNDPIFPAEGAHPYKRDLTDPEFHLLDTGHFALEEDGDRIADLIRSFLQRNVSTGR